MKRITSTTLSFIVAGALFLGAGGCQKQGGGLGGGATASAEKNSFKEVTSRLDAGGSVFVYLSTEQWLNGLSGKASQWREFVASMPNLGETERQNAAKAFDIVTNLVVQSGIEDVSGVGISSIALEKGFYHTKFFLHHYSGQGNGFLWKLAGEKPHAFDVQNLLPANTALAIYSDFDLPLLWSVIEKQARESGFPQAEQVVKMVPAQFETATGLKWNQVLGSLGGGYGLVLTLDDSKMIPIPLPGSDKLQVPEPGLMLVAKVKDDTVFNRIDQELEKSGQQVVRVDKPDLKMRTVAVPLPLPIQLRPTIAMSKGYLFIASSDAIIQEALAVQEGGKPGLKSTDEFKHLTKEIPEEGNQFTYFSRRLGRTLFDVQRQVIQMAPNANSGQKEFIQSLLSADRAKYGYCVSANTDEGWLSVGNGNEQPGKLIALSAVALPAGILAGIAIPNFVKARKLAQENACINNLRQLDAAKQQWALEKNKSVDARPTEEDLAPYLGSQKLRCPSGGHYTLGAVGENPRCSIPGHALPN